MKKYTSFKSLFTNKTKIRKEYGRQTANAFMRDLEGAREAMATILESFVHHGGNELEHFSDTASNAEMSMIVNHIPITHYFVEPGVAEFCEGAVRKMHRDYYRDFDFDEVEAFSVKGKAAIFHFPAESGRKSMLVMSDVKPTIGEDVLREKMLRDRVSGPVTVDLIMCTGEEAETVKFMKSGEVASSDGDRSLLRLAMGLSLYMEAFPETIAKHEGVVTLRNGSARCRARSLSISEDMADDNRSAVSPHWRRGHFRVLRSSVFKEENRGKSVFVRGTFVKGKAYDIKEDAPATATP